MRDAIQILINLKDFGTQGDSIKGKLKLQGEGNERKVVRKALTSEANWVKQNKEKQVHPPEGVAPFIHITRNDFLGQKHKKLKEEDIAICECKYEACNIQSACGESCLNVLTSTECTPGYCPCNEYCRNQKFQKCEYAKTKLFKTEGCGWGLLADANLKAGQFIIEYCGEVISSEDAKQRSQTYLAQGLQDVYMVPLNANYFIDATKKGNLARFINLSCQPNCETRKWTVLGEIRVGIFAKKDISVGTELAYDYNFEWYGGATVRCLCGSANCSLFLGAKFHGFQEHNHVWEDGDDRYMVENIPLYDSAEDEPFPAPACSAIPFKHEPLPSYSVATEYKEGFEKKLEAASSMGSCFSVCTQGVTVKPVEAEMVRNQNFVLEKVDEPFHKQMQGPSSKKRSRTKTKLKAKHLAGNVSSKPVAKLFASKEAQEEITKYEELKNKATSDLNSLYDEIRPAIEEIGRGNQDSVPISVAEKWIHSTCSKWKAEFNFHFSIVKNVMCPPKTSGGEAKPSGGGDAMAKMKSSI